MARAENKVSSGLFAGIVGADVAVTNGGIDIEAITDPEPGHRVNVAMTLTAPGCGMGPAIAEDAKSKILLVAGVSDADVRITWEPAWNQSMISEEGKMKLGLI